MSEENDIVKMLIEQLRKVDKKNDELMRFVKFVASVNLGHKPEEYMSFALMITKEARRLYDEIVGDKRGEKYE